MTATYKSCSSCGRMIVLELFDTATAHGVGCTVRRSLLGKAAHQKKQERSARAKRAAASRRLRSSSGSG